MTRVTTYTHSNPLKSIAANNIENIEFGSYIQDLKQQFNINNKILLVQLPQLLIRNINLQAVRNKAAYAYPPTGLQSIASALSGHGLDILILDLNFLLLKTIIEDHNFDPHNWLDLLNKKLDQFNPCFVGISCISVSGSAQDPEFHLTQILNHLSCKQKYILVAGGPNATDESEYYIKNRLCHFIIKGEGEKKVKYLFDYFFSSTKDHPTTPISGITYLYKNRYLQTSGDNGNSTSFVNLIQSYAQIPIEDYNNFGSLNPFSRMCGQSKHFAPLQLNRGCRADCMFCGVGAFNGLGIRQNSITNLIQEIHYLVEKRHIRHFELLDDDFFGGGKYKHAATSLLSELQVLHLKYGVTWSAGNGLIATSLFEPILGLINSSGCIGFRIGIETANPKMLKKIRKPTSLSALRRLQEQINKYPDLFIAANYIIGFFAEETFNSMMDTFTFALHSNFDWASYSTFQFTSRRNAKIKGFETDSKGATEFIPSKNNYPGDATDHLTYRGMDIFNMEKTFVPNRSQTNEIWYTFNFLTNYVFNKNLSAGGNYRKLISWLNAIELAYPENAIIPLFCSFYYTLDNNPIAAKQKYKIAMENTHKSNYWQCRIRQFNLTDAFSNPKTTPKTVFAYINKTQNKLMERLQNHWIHP